MNAGGTHFPSGSTARAARFQTNNWFTSAGKITQAGTGAGGGSDLPYLSAEYTTTIRHLLERSTS